MLRMPDPTVMNAIGRKRVTNAMMIALPPYR